MQLGLGWIGSSLQSTFYISCIPHIHVADKLRNHRSKPLQSLIPTLCLSASLFIGRVARNLGTAENCVVSVQSCSVILLSHGMRKESESQTVAP